MLPEARSTGQLRKIGRKGKPGGSEQKAIQKLPPFNANTDRNREEFDTIRSRRTVMSDKAKMTATNMPIERRIIIAPVVQ